MLSEIKADLGFGRLLGKERPISTHIPYLRHVSDKIIGLENGALLAVIKLDGLFFQTIDQAELNMRNVMQNTMLRGLGTSQYSLWSTIIRREVKIDISGKFNDPFCEMLNTRYMERLSTKRMFTNEIYLSIVRAGKRGVLGIGESIWGWLHKTGDSEDEKVQLNKNIDEFAEVIGNITKDLFKYGARTLGIVKREGELYSEQCEFLNSIVSCGAARKMRLSRMAIRNHLGQSRLYFGRRTLQSHGATEVDDRFGALISIKEYPPFTAPGLLNGLLHAPHEFILTQSFTIADKPVALERISRLQRQIQASDEGGSQVETDIDFALNSIMNQEAVFGYHHLSLLCLSRTLEGVNRSVSDLGAALSDVNINWLREDLNLEAAFWAQLPGNHAYIARKSMLSSENFAGLSSMHNFARGERENLHWGSPITVLETTSKTPYNFNFHRRDIGHFLVTGPTGSGKTVVLTFLLAQAFRIAEPLKVVFFDKDRGAEIFIRAIGGIYEVLTPGVSTGFNPLQMNNTSVNRAFLLRLFKSMLRGKNHKEISCEDEGILESALSRLMKAPVEKRTIANLASLLLGRTRADANDPFSQLRPWFEGEKSWVFNAEHDTLNLDSKRIFGFDMTSILADAELRTPILLYLFHRFEGLMNGNPIMFFMDEGWHYLQDETFSNFIVDKMKTIRKLNGVFGFGTQSVADIVSAKASHTIIEQAATHLHFPNARAAEEIYVKRFGLTYKEFQFIKRTAPEARTFLIKHGSESLIAKLDLSDMPDIIKVLSGRKETIELCEALRKKYGDLPAQWLQQFYLEKYSTE
ncbi:VirB4 family type IV secretion/conjugal transfer ATPase [Pseudochrobactrum sp. MP213Fo]|uniref:VirB4 family type IV secretion/conjugal transfer ATPase n=1 Tax=Pseudochrobactrum sp. MP213Fo TaxID=3022250 RepID=UPI003BA28BF3